MTTQLSSPKRVALVVFLVFLSGDTTLTRVNASQPPDTPVNPETPWVTQDGNETVFGQPGTNGFRSTNHNYRVEEQMFTSAFQHLVLILMPVFLIFFYNKIMESWVGDHHIRGKCLTSSITVAGFETHHQLLDVEAPQPNFETYYQFNILRSQNDPHKAQLVPKYLSPTNQWNKYSTGFSIAAVADDENGLFEVGDVLIGLSCDPIYIRPGVNEQHALQKNLDEKLASSKWYKPRVPLVITILRPKTLGPLCPIFSFLTEDQTACCASIDLACEDESKRIPLADRQKFVEALGSKVLTELWKSQVGERVLEREEGLVGVSEENNPFNHATQWKSHYQGVRGNFWFATIKHVIMIILALGITLLIVYVPTHLKDSASLRLSTGAVVLLVMVVILGVGAFVMFRNNLKQQIASLQATSLIYAIIMMWFLATLIPGMTFILFRGQNLNEDHRSQAQFTFISTFLGMLFTTLYLLHTLLQVAKARLRLPVPSLLSQHISELVLGTGAFFDAFGGLRELSRGLYANGGACNLADLNSELVKIKRNDKSVKWACESSELDLTKDVADGTSCIVKCATDYIKPVTCYDYGAIGAEWTIIKENMIDKFCCHPFACDDATQTYNHTACNRENDGCMAKTP